MKHFAERKTFLTLVGALALTSFACDLGGDGDGDTATGTDTDAPGTTSTTGTEPGDTVAAEDSTTAEVDPTTDTGEVTGSSSDEGSSTGADWLFGPGSALPLLSCDKDLDIVVVDVELYIQPQAQECLPDKDVDENDVVLLASESWDGSSGTFNVGDGEAFTAGLGASLSPFTGTVDIVVSEPYLMDTMVLDISNGDNAFVGDVELGTCAKPLSEPCPPR